MKMEKRGLADLLDPPDGELHPIAPVHTEFIGHGSVDYNTEAISDSLEAFAHGQCGWGPGELTGSHVIWAKFPSIPAKVFCGVNRCHLPISLGRIELHILIFGSQHPAMVGWVAHVVPIDYLSHRSGHFITSLMVGLAALAVLVPVGGGATILATVDNGRGNLGMVIFLGLSANRAEVAEFLALEVVSHILHLVVSAPHRGNTNMFLHLYIICAIIGKTLQPTVNISNGGK